MASYQFLDQREEDDLHKSRLLNVEEKAFKRITKRLLTPGSLVITPSKLPTPPPDANEETTEIERQKVLDERRQLRDDVLLDFAAFDNSIARIQFLRDSNERERERYKADKEHILETAQAVKDSTAQLRIQLEEAKQNLAQRKKFDELAEKITNNVLLRPRKDQEINLKKLEEECKELQRESRAYGETWKERREQFGRIVEEGMQLRRLIRDEKEEVERREGMDGGQEDGEVGDAVSRGGQTPKHSSTSGNASPRQGTPERRGLKPKARPSGSLSRAASRSASRSGSRSRMASPSRSEHDEGVRGRRGEGTESGEVVEDAVMADAVAKVADTDTPMAADTDVAADTPMADETDNTQAETPQVTINEPDEEAIEGKTVEEVTLEEGTVDEGETGDKMDTT